jgi:hypothetical protein
MDPLISISFLPIVTFFAQTTIFSYRLIRVEAAELEKEALQDPLERPFTVHGTRGLHSLPCTFSKRG